MIDPSKKHLREPAADNVSPPGKPKLVLVVSVIALAVLIVSCVGWLGVRATMVKAELEGASQLLPKLKDQLLKDDTAAAAGTVSELRTHTTSARDMTREPLWTLAAALPGLGQNFHAAQEVATSADDVIRLAAGPLVEVFSSVDWKSLAPRNSGIDLDPLKRAEPKISSAAHAIRQSSDRLNGIDTENLLPQVSAPLVSAREQLAELRTGLDTAASAASIVPELMGADDERRYLLLIQNNAEVRSTGGIPGALAVLHVDSGKLRLESQTSATALGPFDPIIEVDPDQELIYTRRLGKFMQDANLTPDFPTAATTAKAMWAVRTGTNLDGVVSIDPVALSYILDATGPVQLKDPQVLELARNILPTKLTGDNVVRTLLSDVYSKISDPPLQDAYFAGVAHEIFGALSSGKTDAKGLLDGLRQAADERRVLVWSAHPSEQAVIAKYVLGGAISGESVNPAQFGVYFNDGTGAKMDYYVRRTVQLVSACSANGYSEIKVRVTSTNTAPTDAATSLPEYVTGGGAFGVPAGSVQTNITAYGPVQSNVETAVVDGKKTPFGSQRQSGRPVGVLTTRLAPGQTSTIEFTFGKIVQHTAPQLAVTPTVQALKDVILKAQADACVPAA
ncbi:DUF4012 domain-containing protein [Arthrobacter sp. ISL-65]|uniref:DUF4012 domain-containing protein n=1 Tax=Arthrobacter sp. ISL-65 TaxID=2819112 RepID=UPI0020365089|nr:DUF4012 domain-containing protein [Arthrobacter sp. ISL-65]